MSSIQIQSVLFHNEKEALIRSLEAVDNAVRNVRTSGIESVVVKYGDATASPLFSAEEIEKLNSGFKHISLEYQFFGFNSGSARGHNILGEGCSADYMQIMNPDVILAPNYFDEIMKPFASPKVGIVEARQVPIEHPKEYNTETGETDWATTACAVFPTSLFRKLNGFDADTFFLYCDDLDFSWRVRLEGYIIIYQPGAMVFHSKHLSNECKWLSTSAERYYSAEASLLMAYKWSNNQRVEYLLNAWKNSSGDLRRAYQNFIERKENGTLPVQLDPHGKVANFMGDLYTAHRFSL
ncbi:hypothetical protein [Mailhella sp.]